MGDSLTPEISAAMTRRQFFRRSTAGIAIGIPALATLLTTDGFGADTATDPKTGGRNHPAKVGRLAAQQVELWRRRLPRPAA